MKNKVSSDIGLSFDDVVLEPGLGTASVSDVQTKTRITSRLTLEVPILSAANESVTGSDMAIAMAQAGGLGIIHHHMKMGHQVEEVRRVKRHEAFIVEKPITIYPESPLAEAVDLMTTYDVSGIPVLDQTSQKVIGILTSRDIRFAKDMGMAVSECMTQNDLITVSEEPDLEQAKHLLHENRIEKLIILDEQEKCAGLITVKDIENMVKNPNATRDNKGRLRVAASVGIGKDGFNRAQALADAEADVIVVDVPQGHHEETLAVVSKIAQLQSQNIQVIAGNVVTAEGARALIDNGANGIKVGPDLPHISAIMNVAEACAAAGVPVIADCGIEHSEDIAKALAAGADAVVLDEALAGTDEAPGEMLYDIRQTYKVTERTNKHDMRRPSYKGRVSDVITHHASGLKGAMVSVGAGDIEALKYGTKFIQI